MNLFSLLSTLLITINTVTNSNPIISDDVKTPFGTYVRHFEIDNDFAPNLRDNNDYLQSTLFPYATLIRSSSLKYNCHSYAFYSREADNNVWIDDPKPYIDDGSYVETLNPVVGDIIVYYKSNNEALHSAVIWSIVGTGTSDLNDILDNYICISKWGQDPLFRHMGNYGPYVAPNATGSDATSYVKIYHHYHGTYYERYNEYQHRFKWCCNYSDYTYLENHNWRLVRVQNTGVSEIQYQSVYECTICHERVPFLPETI